MAFVDDWVLYRDDDLEGLRCYVLGTMSAPVALGHKLLIGNLTGTKKMTDWIPNAMQRCPHIPGCL